MILTNFSKLLTLAHAIMTLIMTRLRNGWRIHTTRIYRGNGKIMLTLFLDVDYEGKCDMFLSFVDILLFLLIMLDLVFIAGLELLRWLHWKHDFT
jgi:hypothetical protein